MGSANMDRQLDNVDWGQTFQMVSVCMHFFIFSMRFVCVVN